MPVNASPMAMNFWVSCSTWFHTPEVLLYVFCDTVSAVPSVAKDEQVVLTVVVRLKNLCRRWVAFKFYY